MSPTPAQLCYQPIGRIHSPFKEIKGMPIQPSGARGTRGTVSIFPEFAAGLKDLEGFSHIILLYHFHKAEGSDLIVTPFLDSQPHGVFATRAPRRPNPIGISTVRLLKILANNLTIEDVDILDGTPLIDIKPCVPAFDHQSVDRIGWLGQTSHLTETTVADERFARPAISPRKPGES